MRLISKQEVIFVIKRNQERKRPALPRRLNSVRGEGKHADPVRCTGRDVLSLEKVVKTQITHTGNLRKLKSFF